MSTSYALPSGHALGAIVVVGVVAAVLVQPVPGGSAVMTAATSGFAPALLAPALPVLTGRLARGLLRGAPPAGSRARAA